MSETKWAVIEQLGVRLKPNEEALTAAVKRVIEAGKQVEEYEGQYHPMGQSRGLWFPASYSDALEEQREALAALAEAEKLS